MRLLPYFQASLELRWFLRLSFQILNSHVYIIKFSIQKSNKALSKLIFILSTHILDNENNFWVCKVNSSVNCRQDSNPVCAQNCPSKPRCITYILKWKWTSNLVREFWKSSSKILGFACLKLVEPVRHLSSLSPMSRGDAQIVTFENILLIPIE